MTTSPQRPENDTPQSRIHIEQHLAGDNHGNVFGYVKGDVTVNQTVHQPIFRRVFQAPELPTHFVERQEPFEAVKATLVSESAPNTLVVSAIQGLGGIGKSVLAAAIARDPEIKERFPDGIHWIDTLGHEPDLVSRLEGCIHEIEGNTSYRANGVDAEKIAATALRSRLQDKRVLIIVDDVWNAAHVDPFRVGGEGSCLLVTTREAQIRDAQRYDLDVMTAAEARARIEKSLPQSFSAEEDQAIEAFIKAVGYLPLALDLAVAQIQDGLTWPELLAELRSEMVGLAVLHDQSQDEDQSDEELRKYSLQASFNLSLKRLSAQELTCFRWLGVLPEDVAINHRMATTLWDCSEREAKRVLRRFRLKALIKDDQKLLDGTPTYRFHDLVHQTARELLTGKHQLAEAADNWPEAGIELVEAQQQLLERYRQQTQDGLWHTLPHDHYIHAHLTWHFEQANQAGAIHQLLLEETSEGRNGWFEACERCGQAQAFIQDVQAAWHIAEQAPPKNGSAREYTKTIGLQVFYMLISASVNCLAAVPPELFLDLVTQQLWLPEQAIAYARRLKNPTDRWKSLWALGNLLEDEFPNLLVEALAAARAISHKLPQVEALTALGDKFPDVLPEALAVARKVDRGTARATALAIVGNKLSEALPEALAEARAIEDEWHRAAVLTELGDNLPKVIPEALDAARAIRDEQSRADAITTLRNKFPEAFPKTIQDNKMQVETATTLFPDSYLFEIAATHSPELYSETVAKARAEADALQKSLEPLWYELSNLLSLSKGHIHQYDPNFDNVLKGIGEVIEAARAVQEEPFRVETLTALEKKFSEGFSIFGALSRDMLGGLHTSVANSSNATSTRALPEALEAARAIHDVQERARTLIALGNILPEALPQALEAARAVPDVRYRAEALTALGDKFPEALPEALDAARAIQDVRYRAEAFTALGDKLPEALPEALDAACAIQDVRYRAEAFTALGDKLPEALPEALDAARAIQDVRYRAEAFTALGDKLPEALPEALDAARAIPDVRYRAEAFTALGDKLPEALPEALDAARAIQHTWYQARTLQALGDKLPEVLPEALEAARAIQDDLSVRAFSLVCLGDKFPEVLPEALALARTIQDKWSQARLLEVLGDKLPEVLPEAIAAACVVEDERARARLLESLAPKLLQTTGIPGLASVLQSLGTLNRPYCLEVLAHVLPTVSTLIEPKNQKSVLAEILYVVELVCRWWP
jgi:hypothetical protein